MHILTIIGARPQFIKVAVLSRYIKDNPHLGIKETLVHTGQHYDKNMSDIFFDEMDIPYPDYNLQIGAGFHGKMTGLMLEKIEELLLSLKPDMVLVYGDTNSTLAGVLAQQSLQFASHVKLIEPVGYLEMIKYEESCSAVLTDSGGVQKEAFFFKKPCITMRDSIEWGELVDLGWNALTGADTEKIISALKTVKVPNRYTELYGDGKTAEKIVEILSNYVVLLCRMKK